MNLTEQQILSYLTGFLWPLMRISALFISMPVFTVKPLPARIRMAASVLITLVLLPVLPPTPEVELFSFDGWMITIHQIVLGVTAGFILQMVFSIMLLAGQSIAYSMGLGFASMIDPATGVQVPVIAQLFVISGSLMFLGVDGHLLLIELIAQSFTTLPVGRIGLGLDEIWQILSWSSQIFAGGVLLALPIMIALLLVNLSFGIASKAAPQLQIFGVGFPVSIILGMILIWVGISDMLEGFAQFLHNGFQLISHLLRVT